MQLIDFIKQNVPPKKYYNGVLKEKLPWKVTNEVNIKCPFHDDNKPSLSLNPVSGKWYCHACGVGGHSIVDFHIKLFDCSGKQACIWMYHNFIRPIISDKKILDYHSTLLNTPSIVKYLHSRRVNDSTIEKYRLGFDGERITIPVTNEFGLAVNLRRYLPNCKNEQIPKIVNYTNSTIRIKYGSPTMIFPLQVLLDSSYNDTIVLCEGEIDTLSLLSVGINAVTMTNGAMSWAQQYARLFDYKQVVLAFDNDQAGRKAALLCKKRLKTRVKSIKTLPIPIKVGKDVNDWIVKDAKMQKSISWHVLIDRLPCDIVNKDQQIISSEQSVLPLDSTNEVRYREKNIVVEALVAGKDSISYTIPIRINVRIKNRCSRGTCPNATILATKDKVVSFDPNSRSILDLIEQDDKYINGLARQIAGFKCKSCTYTIERTDFVNVGQIILVPTIDSKAKEYTYRTCFFIGKGVVTNKAYKLYGKAVEHPKTQESVLIFNNAEHSQSQIESFKMTSVLHEQLRVFCCPVNSNVIEKLEQIAQWQSNYVTKIIGRSDLHIAVDLAYHSVKSFSIKDTFVRRGMLDILILGDTRCGKGMVAEGLKNYYQLGDIASGENCSRAGLIGGCEVNSNKRYTIKWGLLPLNNNRLVIIDEISAISQHDLGTFSRIRSEGIAEVFKIAREVTEADVRLVWMGNPRERKQISFYNQGIVAVRDLIGSAEDISRFDFALIVSSDEVSSKDINSYTDIDLQHKEDFLQEAFKNLVLWVWSRKAEDVIISPEISQKILEIAIQLGSIYSSDIPLVQSENIRIKLAKISVAIAARLFSTDETGEKVIVRLAHVKAAELWLNRLYSKPNMAYDVFSEMRRLNKYITNITELEQILRDFNVTDDVFLSLSIISTMTLQDWTDGDRVTAKNLIGKLVKLNCLRQTSRPDQYYKSLEFSKWLKERRIKLKSRIS